MVGGEEKGQGGERENTGVEVMAAVVVVGKVVVGGGGVVVVVGGLHSQHYWILPRWSFTDSHSLNPSWQPLGQAHLIQTHTHTNKCTPIQTHSPPPCCSNSVTHRKWTQWCGWVQL